MDSKTLSKLKAIYQTKDGISDEDLLEEAITTLEDYLLNKDKNDLFHHSRVEVIAYLALLKEQARKIDNHGASTDDKKLHGRKSQWRRLR